MGIRRPHQKISLREPLTAAFVFVIITAVFLWVIISELGQYQAITQTLTYKPADWHVLPVIDVKVTTQGITWALGPLRFHAPRPTVSFEIPGVSTLLVNGDLCQLNGGPSLPLNDSAVAGWLTAAKYDASTMASKQFIDDVLVSSRAVRDGRLEDIGFANLQSQGGSYTGSGTGMNFLGAAACIAAIVWLVLAWRIFKSSRVRTARHRGEGRCGKCGNSATHLTTFCCPECQCDTRDVGIDVPLRIPFKGLTGQLIVMGVLWLILGKVCGGILDSMFWQWNSQQSITFSPERDFEHHDPLQSISISTTRTYLSLGRDGSSQRRDGSAQQGPADVVTLHWQVRDHRPGYLTASNQNAFDTFDTSGSRVHHPMQTKELAALLRQSGLNDQRVDKLAAESVNAITAAFAGNLTESPFKGMEGSGGGGSGTFGGDAAWLATAQWPVWLILWLFTSMILIRYRPAKTRIGASKATTATSAV